SKSLRKVKVFHLYYLFIHKNFPTAPFFPNVKDEKSSTITKLLLLYAEQLGLLLFYFFILL
ncbi:MAG: hypothetical protein WBI48_07645, partial [Thermacetogeniaceae bacterium]